MFFLLSAGTARQFHGFFIENTNGEKKLPEKNESFRYFLQQKIQKGAGHKNTPAKDFLIFFMHMRSCVQLIFYDPIAHDRSHSV